MPRPAAPDIRKLNTESLHAEVRRLTTALHGAADRLRPALQSRLGTAAEELTRRRREEFQHALYGGQTLILVRSGAAAHQVRNVRRAALERISWSYGVPYDAGPGVDLLYERDFHREVDRLEVLGDVLQGFD